MRKADFELNFTGIFTECMFYFINNGKFERVKERNFG